MKLLVGTCSRQGNNPACCNRDLSIDHYIDGSVDGREPPQNCYTGRGSNPLPQVMKVSLVILIVRGMIIIVLLVPPS